MIVTCPSCNAQFVVDSRVIPEIGRTLRCSTCKHEWYFTPLSEAQDRFSTTLGALKKTIETPHLPSSLNPQSAGLKKAQGKDLLKKLKQHANVSSASAMVGAAMGVVLAYTVAMLLADRAVEYNSVLSPVFDKLGIAHAVPGQGLILQDVRVVPVQTADGHKTLEIKGRVVNESHIGRHVPLIEAIIESKPKQRALGKTDKQDLASDAETDFSMSFQGWPPANTQVMVRFYLP